MSQQLRRISTTTCQSEAPGLRWRPILISEKIGHSYIGELRGLPNYKYSPSEMAMIRDVWEGGIFRSDIQILFTFDDSDSKLTKYTVQELVTGHNLGFPPLSIALDRVAQTHR